MICSSWTATRPPTARCRYARCSARAAVWQAPRWSPRPPRRMDGLRRCPGRRRASCFTIESRARRRGLLVGALRPGARPHHSTIIVDLPGATARSSSPRGRHLPDRSEVPKPVADAARSCRQHRATWGCVLRLARARGIPVVADLECFSGPEIPELTRQVDHLIVRHGFAGQSTGERSPAATAGRRAARRTRPRGHGGGERAARDLSRDTPERVRHQLACRVEVVDTTGCGDVFHGAYAAALCEVKACRGYPVRRRRRV